MGNTADQYKEITGQEDHPHIHGEYPIPPTFISSYGGSPPHTWGIPYGIVDAEEVPGITPTYMGNTRMRPYTD